MADFVVIPFDGGDGKPLSDFIAEIRLERVTPEQLLAYEFSVGGNTVTNSKLVLANYTEADRERYGGQASAMFVRGLVRLGVPLSGIDRSSFIRAGNLVAPYTSANAFVGEKVAKILGNPGFRPVTRADVQNVATLKDSRISVWAWCKALGSDGAGGFVDLTPFVMNCQTNVTANGGNFSIGLMPVSGRHDATEGWVFDGVVYSGSQACAYVPVQQPSGPVPAGLGQFGLNSAVSVNQPLRRESVWPTILQSNDLIFIRFEMLENELETRGQSPDYSRQGPLRAVKASDLPKKTYDMIGLVDIVTETASAQGNDIVSAVSGRDLMKTLIDDGCYFFPNGFLGGDRNGMFRDQPAGTLGRSISRLIDGSLPLFSAYVDRTVSYSLSFVLNYLTNTGLVNDAVFSAYGGERTRKYGTGGQFPSIEAAADAGGPAGLPAGTEVSLDYAAGVWQIISLVVDETIGNRRLVDSSITTDSGSILNYLRKICQSPFAEIFGDTYGDRYYLIARRPPFDFRGFSSLFTTEISESDIYDSALEFNDFNVVSWYQLIPQGNYMGEAKKVALFDFPAVFFPEYAQIWGQRPMQIVSNYIDFRGQVDTGLSQRVDGMRRQALEDLEYVIGTTAYLPFTKSGTLKIKGDRRIKRGTRIYLRGTREFFYVESVQQVCSVSDTVDRVTVLGVSRGMKAEHIDKYFNVILFDRDTVVQSDGTTIERANYRVNRPVFDYLLRRMQNSANPIPLNYSRNAS